VSVTSANNSTSPKTVTATCTGGTRVLGGGFVIGGVITGPVEILYAYPDSDTTYTARAYEDSAQSTNSNWTVTVWAICG
jgi:hypothetical protein